MPGFSPTLNDPMNCAHMANSDICHSKILSNEDKGKFEFQKSTPHDLRSGTLVAGKKLDTKRMHSKET